MTHWMPAELLQPIQGGCLCTILSSSTACFMHVIEFLGPTLCQMHPSLGPRLRPAPLNGMSHKSGRGRAS